MSFWEELRRRNVVKVGAAYAVVAWLLIQIVDVVLPTFAAPGWVARTVTFLIILGFPVALILAWAYELTPEGVKKTKHVPLSENITHVTGRKLDFAIIALLVFALAFVAVDQYVLEQQDAASVANNESAEPPSDVVPNSVAVLPLENLSLDPENAFVATGLHEEILNQLSKLRSMNVISRTSVMRYGENRPPIPEIGRALHAAAVMEGSVRYAGNRIRVTMQLIDAASDQHLWSETYEREFEDIFAIESDIATSVANALEAEFSPEERGRIEQAATDSPDAYRLYLQAGDVADFETAHRLLDAAIELDPDFALAYAAKAQIYASSLADSTRSRGADVSERAEIERLALENADKGLALDPSTFQAYDALAGLHAIYWRWPEAQAAFEKALELNLSAGLLGGYSWFTSFRGDNAEAIRLARRAVDLSHAGGHARLGMVLSFAGDLDGAANALDTAIESAGGVGTPHVWRGVVEVQRGDYTEAVRRFELAELALGDNMVPLTTAMLAYSYSQMGRSDDVERLFARLEALSAEQSVGTGTWTMAHLARGDADAAYEWLQKAVERVENNIPDEGYLNLWTLKANLFSDPVLNEPRFEALRGRIGG